MADKGKKGDVGVKISLDGVIDSMSQERRGYVRKRSVRIRKNTLKM